MKILPLSFLVAFTALPGLTFAEKTVKPKSDLRPGLAMTEYARHPGQTDPDHVEMAAADFGKVLDGPYLVDSLAPWEFEASRNAVARGYLIVKKDGDYSFTTKSFYQRNRLKIGGGIVCDYRSKEGSIVTIPLKAGKVEFESIGFVETRGSVTVLWRPPGQAELSPIPLVNLAHLQDGKPLVKKGEVPAQGKGMQIVAKDFVVEIYHNGKRVPDAKRELLLDRFGASAEQVDLRLKPGDWIVFHVVANRIRHEGRKFFAMSAPLGKDLYGVFSDPESPNWSSNDNPGLAADFISKKEFGTESRAVPIARPWEEGDKYIRQYAGSEFPGKPIWGAAPSTWLKYVVPVPKRGR